MHSKTYFSFRSGFVYKKLSNQHMAVIVGLLHKYTLMVINSGKQARLEPGPVKFAGQRGSSGSGLFVGDYFPGSWMQFCFYKLKKIF